MRFTGIATLYNNTSLPLAVVDRELFAPPKNPIPSGHNEKLDWNAPWCQNSYDVVDHAIRVAAQFTIFGEVPPGYTTADFQGIYLFLNTEVGSPLYDRVCWAPRVLPFEWDTVMECGEGPSGWVNIAIGDSGENYSVVANAVAHA
jgi:hypothetical protein